MCKIQLVSISSLVGRNQGRMQGEGGSGGGGGGGVKGGGTLSPPPSKFFLYTKIKILNRAVTLIKQSRY